jgi:hypothetical protein
MSGQKQTDHAISSQLPQAHDQSPVAPERGPSAAALNTQVPVKTNAYEQWFDTSRTKGGWSEGDVAVLANHMGIGPLSLRRVAGSDYTFELVLATGSQKPDGSWKTPLVGMCSYHREQHAWLAYLNTDDMGPDVVAAMPHWPEFIARLEREIKAVEPGRSWLY